MVLLNDFTAGLTFAEWGRGIYDDTGCGPRVTVVLPDNSEVEYDDTEAHLGPDTQIKGVLLGSIVEGMDGDGATPVLITNPELFDECLEDLDGTIDTVCKLMNEDEDLSIENDIAIADLLASWHCAWNTRK